jgi:hypothetical protein
MTGTYIGYHNKNFSVDADLTIEVPSSGFSLKFGRLGSWAGPPYEPFVSVIEFSGYSGYIFDQNRNMVGGYLKSQPFNLKFNAFYGSGQKNRLSYSINDTLIANNLQVATGDVFIDAMIFEDYGDLNNLFFTLKQETGSPTVLAGNTGLYILSSNGFYLVGA